MLLFILFCLFFMGVLNGEFSGIAYFFKEIRDGCQSIFGYFYFLEWGG